MRKTVLSVLVMGLAVSMAACGGSASGAKTEGAKAETVKSKTLETTAPSSDSAGQGKTADQGNPAGQDRTVQSKSTAGGAEAAADSGSKSSSDTPVSDWKPRTVISLVLPASAGGTVDLSARIWAQYAKEVCGWDVVVVNSAGATGSVAANQVLQSDPDGCTVLYGHNLVNVANVAGVTDYNYEAFKLGPNFSEEPAQQLYTNTNTYPDLESFIADAKANPGKLQACTEVGAYTYYELLAFEQAAGIDLDFVDVGSTTEKMAALLSEQIVLSPSSYGVAKDYLESGLFTCLGFPGPEPSEVLPDIKTFKEQGIDVEFAPQDFSFYFPKETPDEVIAAYEAATQKILENEDCLKALNNLGQVPKYMPAKEAAENEAKLYKQFKELGDSLN
ncbi:tripartite tricarboxylate transporter substrate binding protein [Clostridium sp. MCC353]|uniref:tripartite tricarboxylate transporter substrate binding protein n=1 Tax=Clostridium sp. MCC353 TaxID=2592646 RepID=UPI001C03671A|nr:tripartite tricarboxylate transporter substrate binding protein [Clostridium sp. MCC353]